MELNYSSRVRDVLLHSKEEALRLGNLFIAPEHLMLGLLLQREGKAIRILEKLKVDFEQLRETIEDKIKGGQTTPAATSLPLLRSTEDRKNTRLNSSHVRISYAVFCLKKKN